MPALGVWYPAPCLQWDVNHLPGSSRALQVFSMQLPSEFPGDAQRIDFPLFLSFIPFLLSKHQPKAQIETSSRSNASLPSRCNASLPSRHNASLPSRHNASLPSQNGASLPSRSNASLPSQSNGSLPSWSNTSLPSQSCASLPLKPMELECRSPCGGGNRSSHHTPSWNGGPQPVLPHGAMGWEVELGVQEQQ